MMQSKLVIIVAAIVAAIIGAWAGMNMFSSGFAMIVVLAIFALIGFLIYNGVSRNRSVERVTDADRGPLLSQPPVTGARAIVYREGFVAKLSGIDIAIDGTRRAQLKSPQSVALDVAPGDHVLTLKVAGKDQKPFSFSVTEGEIAVLRIAMTMTGPEITREDGGAASIAKLETIPMVRSDDETAAARRATTVTHS